MSHCFSSPEENNHEHVHKPGSARGCTDVFWLVLYIVFWLFMIAIAAFAFVYGNPVRLINGFDSFGNTCGVERNERFQDFNLSGLNTLDKPNVFFLDIKEWRQTLKICVKTCPNKRLLDKTDLYKFYKDTNSQLCRYDFNMSLLDKPIPNDLSYFNILGPCPEFPVYESTSLLHRCIPTGTEALHEAYELVNSWSFAQQVFSDLYSTWETVVIMCFVAFVLSIVMIGLIGVLTNIISWVICIFAVIATIATTVVLWLTYYDIRHTPDAKIRYSYFEQFLRNETAIYAMAIIATVIMIVVIIIVCILRKKLSGLAALFEEASNCMMDMPSIILPSILAILMMFLFLAFWVAVVVCLATSNIPGMKSFFKNSPGITELSPDPSLRYKDNVGVDYKSFKRIEYHEADALQNMLWFYVVGLIWTCEFIFACQQLALAGAVVFWYFRKPTDSPVITAICKLLKYHLGSAAKGSILITLFKLPRLILTYLYTKLKKGTDTGSECAQCCMKSCICCFWFLEKFLRFLNHNAYTVIAIENINFCPAAGVAWNAMMANSIQVATTINSIGDFILFLGKLAVGFVCGLISVLWLRHREDIHFYMIPCFFIAVFAFFIAHIILSLFEMVVDTLFLCVCEDKAINGPNGRYKESKLAYLLGEEPVEQTDGQVVEETIRQVELAPINRQPFSTHA